MNASNLKVMDRALGSDNSDQQAWAVAREANGNAPSPYGVTSQADAQRINEILLGRGLTQVQANEWWNTHNSRLGDKTPNQFWLSEEAPSEDTIKAVRDAAFFDIPN
jgi:hypothetical protein